MSSNGGLFTAGLKLLQAYNYEPLAMTSNVHSVNTAGTVTHTCTVQRPLIFTRPMN